jgi:hypothetical protein
MQRDILIVLGRLPDAEVVASIQGLVARERPVTAELVAHLRSFHSHPLAIACG